MGLLSIFLVPWSCVFAKYFTKQVCSSRKSVPQQAGLLLQHFLQPYTQDCCCSLKSQVICFRVYSGCYVPYFVLETNEVASATYSICSVN